MKSFKALLVIGFTCVLAQACSDSGTETSYQSVPETLGRVDLSFTDPPPGITEVVAAISRTGFPNRVLQLLISDSTHRPDCARDVAAGSRLRWRD